MAQRQIAPVALILGLAVAGFFAARSLGEREARRNSEHRADVAAAQIHARVDQASILTESLRRLMAGVGGAGVTSAEFESNSSRWLSPAGFPAAAWVEQVPGPGRATYERRIGHQIVTQDQQDTIAPIGPRPSYLPATLVSGITPMVVPGVDLGRESGVPPALTRATGLFDASATPLATRRDGTKGLFLIRFAPRLTRGVVEPGFVVMFVSELALRAAATASPVLRLTVGGASTGDNLGTAAVRKTFTEAGQPFAIAVPREPLQGTAAVLPWIVLAAGFLLAGLAGALGVNAARRARAQRELDRIFTLTPDLIVVADFDGHFTRINPAVEQVLGYTPEELLARPYLDLVHPDDRERTAAESAAISQGKTALSFENRFVRKDGSARALEWTSAPVVEERLMYSVGRDVTERRQAEVELARLAGEQAALRRLATLVVRGVPPEEVFAAVAEEVVRALPVEYAHLGRYEPDGTVTFVAAWGRAGPVFPVGSRLMLGGKNLLTVIARTGRPAHIASYDDASGAVGVASRERGLRSGVGTPIIVDGRLWGAVTAGSLGKQPLPADTEARLADFTELLATAIANTENRAGLARLAEKQAALRRVATLVARGAPPEEVVAAVVEEVGRLLPVDLVGMGRYEPDRSETIVAAWGGAVERFPVGRRLSLGGDNLVTVVFETGQPARRDSYAEASGEVGDNARASGFRSAVGTPIIVDGRLWGVVIAGSSREQPLPGDTEARLAEFTELVATAITNSESRAALAASRGRIVAAADDARRRIERDLHDGIQQRLVSVGLELRAAQATVPAQQGELKGELSRIGDELSAAFDELREISRGIHPAILSESGLGPALRGLRRRSPVPVELDLHTQRRLPVHVEVAAYYVVSEALTNAAKHAHASLVTVELDEGDAIVRLTIRDDGIGGADPAKGSGLVGLSDRIEALGGTLEITSVAGSGTALLIKIPVEIPSRAGSPEP